jgi:ATP-dependent phosphofructokinase / diphosphate-dependent phosphofructokinase
MDAIGILTAGGDCPGLNAVIRAVVRRADEHGHRVVGVRNGWQGLMEGLTQPLGPKEVEGIVSKGGTILGTSRLDPFVHGDGFASVGRTVEEAGIASLVVVGGDGTLRSAVQLAKEGLGVVGVPKTIDNDIGLTDVTFGFHTAVQIATDAIDRLHTTAEAHNRVMLVEVMGRSVGWIAAYAGIAGGADAILVPEVDWSLDALCDHLLARRSKGRTYSIVVVAEGITPPAAAGPVAIGVDAYGFTRLGGVSYELAPLVEDRTGIESRVVVLGHTQRGGTPTAYDRVLATRLGVAAADEAMAGNTGVMVSLRAERIETVSMAEACATPRALDPAIFDVAKTFFG